jgi:hypothetical protein
VDEEKIMSPMKKTLLGAMAGLSLSMMLSVTPITIAHADPIDNESERKGDDTVSIKGLAIPCITDDSAGTGTGATRCNFPADFTIAAANRGRVELTEPDGTTKSDILWTHIKGPDDPASFKDHFHFISDPTLTLSGDLKEIHEGDFNTLKGTVEEKAGPIDVSDKFGFKANSGTVVVTSDVPEPSTLSLLVLSLAGLGYRLRQRKL